MNAPEPPAVWWSPSLNTVITRGDHDHVYIDEHFALPADAVRLISEDAADADALVRQARLKGMTIDEGAVELGLESPRELMIAWVWGARAMLGDAPNYSETRVDFPSASMTVKAAGEIDRYVLTVQRAGKLTPHEARQAAEAERDQLRSELAEEKREHLRTIDDALRVKEAWTAREQEIAAAAAPDTGQAREADDLTEALNWLRSNWATNSRDWALDRREAAWYGVLVGWDCEEDHDHDDICGGTSGMDFVARRHVWAPAFVEALRRRRAAVAAAQSGDTVQAPDVAATVAGSPVEAALAEIRTWLADDTPYCILPVRSEHLPAVLARLDELEQRVAAICHVHQVPGAGGEPIPVPVISCRECQPQGHVTPLAVRDENLFAVHPSPSVGKARERIADGAAYFERVRGAAEAALTAARAARARPSDGDPGLPLSALFDNRDPHQDEMRAGTAADEHGPVYVKPDEELPHA